MSVPMVVSGGGGRGRGVPQVNKFEQVSSLGDQMSVPVWDSCTEGAGAVARQGCPCTVRSHVQVRGGGAIIGSLYGEVYHG